MPVFGPFGARIPLDLRTRDTDALPAIAGTTYTQALDAAALSFTGAAPLFTGSRSLGGSLSFTGAATRVFTGFRTLTASFTPTGATVKFALARALTRAAITPTGAFAHTAARSVAGALTFIGGTNQYPDPALYPGPDQFPYGGAILFQLNRTLGGVMQPVGSLATHMGAGVRLFTAVLQPQVVFFKVSARILLSASFASGSLIATRVARNVFQSLFASLRAAGAMSTIVNPGYRPPGGGGWGVPMGEDFFQRYKPTLRRQKMRA